MNFISNKSHPSRFPSLGDCYELFDDLRTPNCPGPQIEEDGNVHICAASDSGDICNGDSGSGLVTVDKHFMYKLDSSLLISIYCFYVTYIHRNYIIIGVVSFNLGCNSVLQVSGKSLFFRRDSFYQIKQFQKMKNCRVSCRVSTRIFAER